MFNRQNPATSQLPRQQRSSINTSLQSFYASDNSMQFSVALWNDKVSISWVPTSGQDANGIHRYDWQHRIGTALSIQKCAALVSKFKAKFEKYLNGSEPIPVDGTSIGVLVGGVQNGTPGMFMITLYPEDNGSAAFAVSLVRNISDMGVDPTQVVTFKFGKTSVIVDYDPTKGGQMISEDVNDFDIFFKILSSYSLMLGMVSHESRYHGQFVRNRGGFNNNNQANNTSGQSDSGWSAGSDFQTTEYSVDEIPFQ
jgi:hypothetical protein